MSRHRPWLLSVLLVCLGASVGGASLSAQAASSIEFLDRRGAATSAVPENGTWRIRVVDPLRDDYPLPDLLNLEATSTATGDQEYFILRETGNSTGVFEGFIETATGPSGFGNKILETSTGPAPDFQLDTVQIRHNQSFGTFLTATATVVPSITELVDDFGNPAAAYTVGHKVRVRVEDHNLDSPLVVGTTTVQLTTLCNDVETLVLTETGAATQIYEGSLDSNTGPTFGVPGDGAVQLVWPIPDFVTAVHADANGGTQSSDVAGSNNGSVVFLDEDGGPLTSLLEGSRVHLRVYEYLGGYPNTQQSRTVTLQSTIGGDQQTVYLWETGPITGVYEGWITIEPTSDPTNYQLLISRIVNGPGSPPTYDTLTASYMPYDGPLTTATANVTGFAEIAVVDEDGREVDTVPAGDRLRVRVRNPGEKEADFVLATARSSASSEREPLLLFRTAAGSDVFEGSIPMVEADQAYPEAFNGTLEIYLGETIEVDHVNASATDSVKDTFTPTGARVQFLDPDGEPTDRIVLGLPVRLRVFNQISSFPLDEYLTVSSEYPGSDWEAVTLTQVRPGVFEGTLPMALGPYVYNDGKLDVTEIADPLPARYNTVAAGVDCADLPLCPRTSAEITPALVAFVNEQGRPMDAYAVGSRVYVRLTAKGQPNAVDQAQVVVRALGTGSQQTVTLTETGVDTNRFVGSVLTADEDGPATSGRVRVRAGETISAVYTNSGGTASVDDTARVAAGTVELLDAAGAPAESYLIGTAVHVRAVQASANTSPTAVNVAQVKVWTALSDQRIWDSEYLYLLETGPDTGIFTGTMEFPHGYPSGGDGRLQAYYGVYDWEIDYNPMTVVVSLPNDPYTVADRAGTHPVEMSFVDAQGNPTETLALGGPVRLRVTDHRDSAEFAASIYARLASAATGDTVDLFLTESGPDTGLYEAVVPSAAGAAVSGDTTLQSASGDTVRASHLGSYGNALVAVASASVTVNEPPVANPEQVYSLEDSVPSVSVNVLANDTDPEGQPLQVTAIDYQTGSGTVTFTANGVLTFTPNPNYYGVLDVTYTASDGLMTDTAHAYFIVEPVLDGPVANPDTVTILEGGQVQISVRDNDQVGDTLGLSVGAVTNGAHGTAVNLGNTWVVYTATDYDYHGTDTFTYVIEDGAGLTATGTVTVIIDPVDDLFIAQNDAATTNEDTPVTIAVLANDIDVDSAKSVTAVTQGAHGTVALNPDSTVTYTPAANYSGTDTFTYTGTGEPGDSQTATVTVTITPANDAPVANDASFSLGENSADGTAVGTVTATDPDAGQVLTYAITAGNPGGAFAIDASNGAITVASSAALDHETAPAFTLTVTASDNGTPSLSDTATVTISVNDVNEAPAANDATFSVAENVANGATVGTVTATDPDQPAQTLTYAITGGNTAGIFAIDGTTGAITVVNGAALDFEATPTYALTVTVTDNGTPNLTDTAAVTVNVSNVNEAPTATADSASTNEDAAVSISVLTNDTDPEDDNLSVSAVTQGANGTVTFTASAVTYTPAANFSGSDSFSYTLSDGNGGTATANVSITITGVNDAPVAVADSASTNEDSGVSVSALANDTDPENDSLAVTAVTQGTKGAVTFTAAGVTYTPAANANGADSFTYTVSDGNGGTATGTVSVTISAVNDAPIAAADAASTSEDSAVTVSVLANDNDPENDNLAVTAVTQGANGSVTFTATSVTYTPAANFSGADSFSYTISDGNGGTASASVSITISGVNDAPVATADTASTSEDSTVTVSVLTNDNDPENDNLAVTAVTQGANGSVTFTATSVTYTPAANFSGTDSFSYTISDGNGGTASASVSITISGVNDAPVATADTASTSEDSTVTVSVLANDSDPENDNLAVTAVTQGANGSVTFTATSVTYTPAANFSGTDSFSYNISDGNGGTASASVSITISGVNDAPVATADTASTSEDSAVTVSVLANDNDPENDNLAVTAITQGANGSVAFTATSVTYTPAANFSGADSFSYTISDGNGGTASASVSITVSGLNDPPVTAADSGSTAEDSSVTINVLTNDSDPENNSLAVTGVTQGANGSVTFTATSVTYTPAANFNGSDSFTYTVSDGNGGTATGSVSVTVTAANDGPVAAADSATTNEDNPVAVSVLANDSDPDGHSLTVTAVTQGAKGAVTFNAGSVTYTPAANTNGADSFSYTISDGNGGTATANVTVNVTPVNDAPDALNDAATTSEDTAAVIAVLANDLEADGEPLQVIAVTQGTRGAVSINANGTVTYVPNANTSGADSFTYTARDASGSTDTATVSVSVTAVNDAPNALADTAVTRENTAIGINLLANDTDVEGNPLSIIAISTPAFGTAVRFAGNPSISYTPNSNFNGVDTLTYTVSDGQGGTATGTVTITVKDALERVAVLGTNSVYIQTGADVLSGDVIANQSGTGPFLNSSVELSFAGSVTTAAGYDVQANRMVLAAGSTVGGDAFYNTRTGTGGVTGSTTSPLTLPIFSTLPAFPTATPGSTNISVGTNGTRILSAGSYGDLVVGRKGVVTLDGGGTFHFRSIRLDREARLIINTPSQIRVQQKLTTANLVDIGPSLNAPFDASSIIFYVGGINGTGGGLAETPKAVEIGTDTALDANLYAPNGTIWLQDRTQARGSYLGKDVQVGVDVQVTLDSFHTGQ